MINTKDSQSLQKYHINTPETILHISTEILILDFKNLEELALLQSRSDWTATKIENKY